MILKKRIHCKDWVLKLCTFDKENYYIMHVWKGELCWNYVHSVYKIGGGGGGGVTFHITKICAEKNLFVIC